MWPYDARLRAARATNRSSDEDDDSDTYDSSEEDQAHGEPGPGATAKRARCDGGPTDTAAANNAQAAGANTPAPPPLPLPTDTTTIGCCTPGCTRRALFTRGPCCLSCPGAFGRGRHPCHSPSCDAEHTPTSPPPRPTLPTPTPTPTPAPTHPKSAPQQRPTQLQPDAPHPSHHEPQTSRAGRRGPSWNHALLAAAAILAPVVHAAHAGAPLITVRRVERRGGLALLCGALLASAATSCLPTTSSSPLPAPADDGRRAGDPPLTPDRTTGPTDLYPYETDDDQQDQGEDHSDGADDPAPPVEPPDLPISGEAGNDMDLTPVLSDAQHAVPDLTSDADETTQAIVRHELEATGATATAAQPHSNDAPTSPAAEPLRSPRCPEHE